MAEALLARELGADQQNGIEVRSAGLHALVGRAADETAQRVMRHSGFDISAHRAEQLTADLLHWSDLILVMEAWQKKAVDNKHPSARGKVYRLGEQRDLDIPDPYGEPESAFQNTVSMIMEGVSDWIPKLAQTGTRSDISS